MISRMIPTRFRRSRQIRLTTERWVATPLDPRRPKDISAFLDITAQTIVLSSACPEFANTKHQEVSQHGKLKASVLYTDDELNNILDAFPNSNSLPLPPTRNGADASLSDNGNRKNHCSLPTSSSARRRPTHIENSNKEGPEDAAERCTFSEAVA